MKKLTLTKGHYTLVDDEDFEYLNQWKWHYHSGGYAARKAGVRMHRIILSAPQDEEVDHINGDGLDNRRANLRLCTRSQNCQNRSIFRNNTTGHKGVSLRPGGKYRARIWLNKTCHSLGDFVSVTEASKAVEQARQKYHGDFAW
jgi:hypothetical protein